MRSTWSGLALAILVLVIGCSSESDLAASFAPDTVSPGNGTVSMAEASQNGDLVTVAVNVTGVDNVYGASFQVHFDAARLQFVASGAGTLLESGGRSAVYNVQLVSPGVLEVGGARVGGPPGVDVTVTTTLIRLTFRVLAAGAWHLDFDNDPDLQDDTAGNPDIPGLTWTEGAVVGT